MNTRKLGTSYEKIAADYLTDKGYEILEMNFRNRMGEIDIIAKDKEYYCFVEVKYRKNSSCGYALEAVTAKKQRIIRKVAMYYMMINNLNEWTPCRFDIVAIDGEEISLLQNAF